MVLVMDQIQQEVVEQQQLRTGTSNKYYCCRICKKGFTCGRALGGHMRAHGIHDDVDVEPSQPYALRSNPNRPKTCSRGCENFGSEFSSWKSFLEYGGCGFRDGDVDERTEIGGCGGWSKGKRTSKRAVVLLDEPPSSGSDQQDDMAASCLVLLSTARVELPQVVVTETEESCALRGLFECKACKRAFTSHQALGGHRASHKKVKGCFASKQLGTDYKDETAERMVVVTPTAVVPQKNKKGKLHECTICHRVFPSGQALGGHKRCHWLPASSNENPPKIHVPPPHDDHQLLRLAPMSMEEETTTTGPPVWCLDLNLPATTKLQVSPDDLLCLQDHVNETVEGDVNVNYHDHVKEVMVDHEEEERRKEKVAKLSENMDVTMDGESSRWLQVGIRTCANVS